MIIFLTPKKLLQNMRKKEKIGIFGDYDVDGASATALLGNFFSSINLPYEILKRLTILN